MGDGGSYTGTRNGRCSLPSFSCCGQVGLLPSGREEEAKAQWKPVTTITVPCSFPKSPTMDSSVVSLSALSVATTSSRTSHPIKSSAVKRSRRNEKLPTLSNNEPKHKKQKKKTSSDSMSPTRFSTLQQFYDCLDQNQDCESSFHHKYLIQISSWIGSKTCRVQSTPCTNPTASASTPVLSTSSVSSTPSTSNRSYPETNFFSAVAVERNEDVQIHRLFGLSGYDHFSVNKKMLQELKNIIPSSAQGIERNFMVIPNSMKLYNASNVTVLNRVKSNHDNKCLSVYKTLFGMIFNKTYPYFSVSSSKSRNLPSISLGWTTTDCHAYKHHRTNIVGKIKPFLVKVACENLSKQTTCRIAKLSCHVIQRISDITGSLVFTYDTTKKSHKRLSQLRSVFHSKYAELLGITKAKDPIFFDHFQCDRHSIIVNPFVSRHKDTNNDNFENWDNTLSVNACLPITKDMWDCYNFKKILKKLGY